MSVADLAAAARHEANIAENKLGQVLYRLKKNDPSLLPIIQTLANEAENALGRTMARLDKLSAAVAPAPAPTPTPTPTPAPTPAPSPTPTPAPQPAPAPVVAWNNTATRDYFDSVLQRRWRNPDLGDWIDTFDLEQGVHPFGASPPVKALGEIRIFVGELRDMLIIGSKLVDVKAGLALEIDGVRYPSVAETHLAPSTTAPQAASITRKGTILARFDALAGEAVLVLTVQKIWSGGGGSVFEVFRPAPRLKAVTRPAWVQPDPTVLLDVQPLGTKTLAPDQLTWFSRLYEVPPSEVAFATVFLKLHDDFAPGDEGKLPGLSNTGQATRDAVKTGWGGRQPDGIHWSARSGYGRYNDAEVALRTYFYAMAPHNHFGHVDPTGRGLPKGRWIAYVQGVRLNTPGVADGGLFYWLAGEGDVYARDDIRWRESGDPQSLIREFWFDCFCGGTANGGQPSTISGGSATVTPGLPDLAAIEAEVAMLNA